MPDVISITLGCGAADGCSPIADENLEVWRNEDMASEPTPLWDTVTRPFASALEFAFGCHHAKLSRVFTIEGHTYKVCCGCGARFEYSLRTMSITSHYKLLSSLRQLRAGRIYRRRRSLRRAIRT
jgi:hypothetical protein